MNERQGSVTPASHPEGTRRSPGTPTGVTDQGSQQNDPGAAPESVAKLPGNGEPPPLESAPLAYENHTFLNSADGRLIRILAEYCEPLARFRKEQIQDTVVFFGSAPFRGREDADHERHLLRNTRPPQP